MINDITSSLGIKKNALCLHLLEYNFDNLSRKFNTMEHIELYLDSQGLFYQGGVAVTTEIISKWMLLMPFANIQILFFLIFRL